MNIPPPLPNSQCTCLVMGPNLDVCEVCEVTPSHKAHPSSVPKIAKCLYSFLKITVDLLKHVNFKCTAKWLSFIYVLLQIVFPCRLSPDIEHSSLCRPVGPCYLPSTFPTQGPAGPGPQLLRAGAAHSRCRAASVMSPLLLHLLSEPPGPRLPWAVAAPPRPARALQAPQAPGPPPQLAPQKPGLPPSVCCASRVLAVSSRPGSVRG